MEEWNKTELDSYLIEISAAILQYQDNKNEYLVEKIRDTAGQVSEYREFEDRLPLFLALNIFFQVNRQIHWWQCKENSKFWNNGNVF